ncbi:MAG: tRNA guanosine(34) transglycosylase Tgt [Ilumatobacteraceae bacterium]
MHEVMLEIKHTDGSARTGTASTARGAYETPCFMPVGTRGAVKHMSARDYADLGARIVLGNTYHLMLRPGADTIASLGGLGAFAGWDGLTLTDSGGFQVFSLDPHVDDDGVTFKSTYDGSTHRFTPESAVDVQQKIGADIQMVLDVCTSLPADDATVRLALERTASWALRAKNSHTRADQSLFGIVQGGTSAAMRRESAERTVEVGFDGYAIGGLSVGETRAEMVEAIAACIDVLPADRPRYLMGVGDPASLVEAVSLGVDQFDCVLQTRLGRHGTALTWEGKVQVKNARHALDDSPLDARCRCWVCSTHSRGYLRHLAQSGEPTGARLVSIHNVAWTLQLMDDMRRAIADRRLDALRAEILQIWG